MGNWRTVEIVGRCDEAEVDALSDHVGADFNDERWGCLCGASGLAGLGNWAAARINASGNLAERDYEVEDVAENLRELAKTAPSLSVKVHCGGDYEDATCVATITCHAGCVSIGEPETEAVSGASQDAMMGRLFAALGKGGR